MKKVKNKIYL